MSDRKRRRSWLRADHCYYWQLTIPENVTAATERNINIIKCKAVTKATGPTVKN